MLLGTGIALAVWFVLQRTRSAGSSARRPRRGPSRARGQRRRALYLVFVIASFLAGSAGLDQPHARDRAPAWTPSHRGGVRVVVIARPRLVVGTFLGAVSRPGAVVHLFFRASPIFAVFALMAASDGRPWGLAGRPLKLIRGAWPDAVGLLVLIAAFCVPALGSRSYTFLATTS